MLDRERLKKTTKLLDEFRIAGEFESFTKKPSYCSIDRIVVDDVDKFNDFIADMGYQFVGFTATNPAEDKITYLIEFEVLVK